MGAEEGPCLLEKPEAVRTAFAAERDLYEQGETHVLVFLQSCVSSVHPFTSEQKQTCFS